MVTKSLDTNYNRFSDVINEPLKMLLPIQGYANQPLVSLEEAIQPLISLIPDLKQKVSIVKKRSQNPADGLSSDESAAIMLYTMERSSYKNSLYFILNSTLRTENRSKLHLWYLYLKLILTALNKLPSINNRTIYRLVKYKLNHLYPQGRKFIWWSFSSCIKDFEQQDQIDRQTLFVIRCNNAKDISPHCYYQTKNEVLIFPATQFHVIAQYPPACNIQIIQIQEIKSDVPLLQPLTNDYDSIPRYNVLFETDMRYKNSYILHIKSSEFRSKVDLCFQDLIDDNMNFVISEGIIKKQCRELWLDNNMITSKGVSILAEVLHFNHTLKGLYLAKNHVCDLGVMYLSEVLARNNSALRELGLAANNITDIGAKCLADMLKTNQILTSLGLSENSINKQGIEVLINVLAYHNNTLQILYIDSNSFEINTIIDCLTNMLERNQSLKKLYIGNCGVISEVCKEKLRKIIELKDDFALFI